MGDFDKLKADGNILGSNSQSREKIGSNYFTEIGKQELLTKEQEYKLMRKIKAGDKDAYKQMISKNLRLVVQIAVKYNSSEFGLMDRISEGNLGLIHAIEKFDVEKGYRFSTYAHWWIKQSIERAIMNQGRSVRLPVHVVRLLSKYNKASCRMTHASQASIAEIAKELDCDPKQMHQMLSNCENAVHLDQKSKDTELDMQETVYDADAPDACEQLLSHDFQGMVLEVLHNMSPYEHFIIVRHMGLIGNERNTFIEISKLTGFTREQVRAREVKGLARFRSVLNKS